ncbi:MAG: hypothetical protein JWR62_214, partial [Modestobacter sp.]|nr:hypothetical protein [Modestobacter sp.]
MTTPSPAQHPDLLPAAPPATGESAVPPAGAVPRSPLLSRPGAVALSRP